MSLPFGVLPPLWGALCICTVLARPRRWQKYLLKQKDHFLSLEDSIPLSILRGVMMTHHLTCKCRHISGELFSSCSAAKSSDSSRPHGLQHSRPPCPSPSPEVCPSSCPLLGFMCNASVITPLKDGD